MTRSDPAAEPTGPTGPAATGPAQSTGPVATGPAESAGPAATAGDPLPPTGPFTAATGFRLTAVGPDRVEGVAEVGPEQHQPHGIVHGGAWCAIVETAASIGAQSFATARGLGIVGVHNGTNFLRPVRSGRMDVVAVPLHQGRTQQLWDVRITDEGGRVVATGQVRLVHLERGEG